MISIRELNFSYPAHPVFESMNADFEPGKVHGILGINGAGKTTLFNLLYGLIKPEKGEVRYAGSTLTKPQMSFLETQNYFYPHITGGEYLSLFNQGSRNSQLEGLASLFKLPLRDLIDHYSTGMKKKLAFLAILLQDREILLLDEPFNGIDLEASRLILATLDKLRSMGKTVLVTSHIYETLSKSSDQIHVLESGTFGPPFKKESFGTLEESLFGEMDKKMKHKLDQLWP